MEFLPIMEILKTRYTADTLPYHIIVPSLPGYAFSSPPPLHRDFKLEDVATIMHSLMCELGFDTGFVCQGGDIGSKVSRVMGAMFETVKAVHSKLISLSFLLVSFWKRRLLSIVKSISVLCLDRKVWTIARWTNGRRKV